MQTIQLPSSQRGSWPFGGLVKQVSNGNVVDFFQRAALDFRLFGPGAGLAISFLLLVSVFMRAVQSSPEKGVI